MYKNIIFFLLAVCFVISIAACKKDVEDRKADAIMEDLVWDQADSLGTVAQYFVDNLYNYLPNGFNRIDGDYLDAATDDASSIQKRYAGILFHQWKGKRIE